MTRITRHAVVIGINLYEDKNLRKLDSAVADARRVAGFFQNCGFTVEPRYESEATCKEIQHLLKKVKKSLRSDDTFLFYFAGHGVEKGERNNSRQVFLAYDTDWELVEPGGGNVITLEFVRDYTNVHGVSRAIVLDCCRKRIMPDRGPGGGGRERDPAAYSARDFRQTVECAGDSPVRILCSCRPGARAFEVDGGGVFTSAMLEVFGRYRDEGKAIGFYPEAERDIRNRMAKSAPQPQKPYIEGDVEIILVPERDWRNSDLEREAPTFLCEEGDLPVGPPEARQELVVAQEQKSSSPEPFVYPGLRMTRWGAVTGAAIGLVFFLAAAIVVQWRLAQYGHGHPLACGAVAIVMGLSVGAAVGGVRAGRRDAGAATLLDVGADVSAYAGMWVGGLALFLATVLCLLADGTSLEFGWIAIVGLCSFFMGLVGTHLGVVVGRGIGLRIWGVLASRPGR